MAQSECLEEGFLTFTRLWGDYEPPPTVGKTFERTWAAVEEYFKQYPLTSDPIRPYSTDFTQGVEFKFGIPLPFTHPDTGDPLLFGGRADLLGYYRDIPAIVDEKTTGALGASWADQWKMRGQFHGYVWAAREIGIPVKVVVIRGVAILKTKITTMEVIKMDFPEHMLNRWKRNMLSKIQNFINMYEYLRDNPDKTPEDILPMSFSDACISFGGCSFVDLCLSPDPSRWYGDFGVRNWNPLD